MAGKMPTRDREPTPAPEPEPEPGPEPEPEPFFIGYGWIWFFQKLAKIMVDDTWLWANSFVSGEYDRKIPEKKAAFMVTTRFVDRSIAASSMLRGVDDTATAYAMHNLALARGFELDKDAFQHLDPADPLGSGMNLQTKADFLRTGAECVDGGHWLLGKMTQIKETLERTRFRCK